MDFTSSFLNNTTIASQ